ncbi:ATP-binding protein [Pseudomonas aylmerensis]|uniref:ATP-binding protein n=1 Tax=Pseudomonas aylmerensis TaxID=1869229 RepID=A0A2T4G1N9_9PSED|nr:ATP-binding protein [Pseudomonas aylmerensis]PTC29588.1 ATP-binding protein [Pseudomonas aylmerensis]
MNLDEFLTAPRESLNIELKSWIDPTTAEGKAKIVKAAIALRNVNGGYLGIGISDEGNPLSELAPENIDDRFHQDTIQALIARHSSESFEVSVEFGTFNGIKFPFITIPSGVRTPVAAKLGINDPNNQAKELVKKDTVYVRTLAANHTPSSAAAQFSDWPQIMNICFDNREADIGNFVRRHLSGLDIPRLLSQINGDSVEPETAVVDVFLNECHQRFLEIKKADDAIDLGKGLFEVAVIIKCAAEREAVRADDNFLSSFIYANPGLNGWPLWLDSRAFLDPKSRPRTRAGGYEALIEDYEGSFILPHLDFWRAEPSGRFYHCRVLWDDLVAIKKGNNPNEFLAVDIAIRTVTEAISVAISFAKSMAFPEKETTLKFAFRWSGLEGRELSSYNSLRYISPGRVSGDDQITTHANISLDISPSSIPSIIPEIVSELFSSFNGMTFSKNVIEEIALELLQKK